MQHLLTALQKNRHRLSKPENEITGYDALDHVDDGGLNHTPVARIAYDRDAGGTSSLMFFGFAQRGQTYPRRHG